MEDYGKTIHIVAVSDSQESASSLLSSCITGISTSDNQEWISTEGEFTLKCYLKYPGSETFRRAPEHFLDVLLANSDSEEVLNYVLSRQDAPLIFWVDQTGTNEIAEGKSLTVSKPENVLNFVKEQVEKVKEYNKFYLLHCNDKFEVEKEKISNFMTEDQFEENLPSKVAKYNTHLTYPFARKLHFFNKRNSNAFKLGSSTQQRGLSFLDIAEGFINDFISKSSNSDSSNINLSVESKIVPTSFNKTTNTNENVEAEGVGFSVELLLGEDFKKKFSVQPLVIRDNLASLTVEIPSKSATEVDSVYATLQGALAMAEQFGLMEKVKDFGASVSLRKESGSVFVDVALGGLFGDFINNKLNKLNLDIFKSGLYDRLSIRTSVNAKDLYENFKVDSIVEKLCSTTIIGKAKLLNIKTILSLFKEFLFKYKPSDDDYSFQKLKKKMTIALFALNALCCFETNNLEVTFCHKDIKEAIINLVDGIKGEEFYKEFTEGLDGQVNEGILPMVFSQIEGFKGLAGMFGEGASLINLDKISVDFIVPGVQFNLNLSLFLTGLSDFLLEKVFS